MRSAGWHLIMDGVADRHDYLNRQEHLEDWLMDLTHALEMRPVSEPVVSTMPPGSPEDLQGFSASILWVESHAAIHTWEHQHGCFNLDVFSCRLFDSQVVRQTLEAAFGFVRSRGVMLTRRIGAKATPVTRMRWNS